MLSVNDFIVMVRSTVGCDYAHAGRCRRGGLDCVGVFIVPLADMGIFLADERNYTREAFDKTLAQEVGKRMDLVSAGDRKPGDILLFWCNRNTKLPQHVAVLTSSQPNEMMVHAYMPAGKVVETPIGSWVRRLTHVFRVPSHLLARP